MCTPAFSLFARVFSQRFIHRIPFANLSIAMVWYLRTYFNWIYVVHVTAYYNRILKMCLHLIECEDMWLCCCLYIVVRDSMLDDDWIPSSHHANVAWFEMNIFLAHLSFECCDLRWLFRFNICYNFLFTSVRTFTCANICYIHHLCWEIELEKEL